MKNRKGMGTRSAARNLYVIIFVSTVSTLPIKVSKIRKGEGGM
jgi:hypothetical protein